MLCYFHYSYQQYATSDKNHDKTFILGIFLIKLSMQEINWSDLIKPCIMGLLLLMNQATAALEFNEIYFKPKYLVFVLILLVPQNYSWCQCDWWIFSNFKVCKVSNRSLKFSCCWTNRIFTTSTRKNFRIGRLQKKLLY